MDYRNLPYRTIDIDVQMGRPLYEESDDSNIIVRLDRWNVPEESSFQQYLIRVKKHAGVMVLRVN